MATWQPNPQSLAQLYQLIQDSKSLDAVTRNQAAQVIYSLLARLSTFPSVRTMLIVL